MQDVQNSQEQWDKERGAIEQEVARDLSNPTYKFVTRLNEDLFAGTPYAHDALGTKSSFDATTAAMLKDFYKKWYAPNNAILVITGNVDPDATIKRVKELYGPIPRRPLPPRPDVKLRPVKAESFTMDSDLPYQLVFVAYRTPGSDSPDYAAARVLSDVMASERAELYSLVTNGDALATVFELEETYPKASVSFAAAAIPPGADASAITSKLKEVVAAYLSKGLPADLIEAAKRKQVASAEFERNSIPAWQRIGRKPSPRRGVIPRMRTSKPYRKFQRRMSTASRGRIYWTRMPSSPSSRRLPPASLCHRPDLAGPNSSPPRPPNP